ncbi:MAG: tryptophan synthase subunit alpha [Verrucomicrobiae bacterium]|nr:tryptophan synthase subunit alpha [Verrucomicrobiae bacterium]
MSQPSTNRIDQKFADLKSDGKAAFIAYVCAGDPDMPRSLEILRALETAGADVIELGVPFSDPMADGIVNQMAAHRALEAGASLPKVLDLIREFRKESQLPLVLFTYLNPVYTYGFERFHHEAAAAGADGVLLLDLPPDESPKNAELHELPDLRHIRLIAPTTPKDRIPLLAKASEGFIYYVSRAGVTGAQSSLAVGIAENVAAIKAHTDLPIAVGFGISTPEQAAEVARAADGVVVGSAIVRQVEENADADDIAERVGNFVKPLVDATKSA